MKTNLFGESMELIISFIKTENLKDELNSLRILFDRHATGMPNSVTSHKVLCDKHEKALVAHNDVYQRMIHLLSLGMYAEEQGLIMPDEEDVADW